MSETETQRARAEAASWVARLHGPDRSAEVESGLKRWLAESALHAAAFESATDVWQETADLPARLPLSARAGRRYLMPAVAAALCLLVAAAWLYLRPTVLATVVGEQRTLVLSDGSRVTLNTDSRVLVRYEAASRTVVLESGEAVFDVAKRQSRPFVVLAGRRKIVALGTTFVVRCEADTVSVTLMEGRVAVSGSGTPGGSPLELAPGQRLTFDASRLTGVDFPALDRVTAWQRGQLMFESTPLREAIREFNRYGAAQIALADPALGDIPVGGVFRIGDRQSFAQAVADSNGLRMMVRGERIVLAEPAAGSPP